MSWLPIITVLQLVSNLDISIDLDENFTVQTKCCWRFAAFCTCRQNLQLAEWVEIRVFFMRKRVHKLENESPLSEFKTRRRRLEENQVFATEQMTRTLEKESADRNLKHQRLMRLLPHEKHVVIIKIETFVDENLSNLWKTDAESDH